MLGGPVHSDLEHLEQALRQKLEGEFCDAEAPSASKGGEARLIRSLLVARDSHHTRRSWGPWGCTDNSSLLLNAYCLPGVSRSLGPHCGWPGQEGPSPLPPSRQGNPAGG